MRWFRFYDDVVDDPKVQRLPAPLFKAWVNLLCLASKGGGSLPADIEDIAFALRTDVKTASHQIDELKKAGLLDEDEALQPHNWSGRQYASDDSGERVRRFRQRRRNVTPTVTETPQTENVTVVETPPDTETEADTEQRQRSALVRAEFENEFDTRFWPIYPEKKDRKNALKAFLNARKRASLDEILTGLEHYRAEIAKPGAPKPKYAQGWLTAERWKDGVSIGGERQSPRVTNEFDDGRDRADETRVGRFKAGEIEWAEDIYGPAPGKPGCRVAEKILRHYGYSVGQAA